jgi:hypothetical protein
LQSIGACSCWWQKLCTACSYACQAAPLLLPPLLLLPSSAFSPGCQQGLLYILLGPNADGAMLLPLLLLLLLLPLSPAFAHRLPARHTTSCSHC